MKLFSHNSTNFDLGRQQQLVIFLETGNPIRFLQIFTLFEGYYNFFTYKYHFFYLFYLTL